MTPYLVSHRDAAELAGVSLATWMRMVSAARTPAPIKLSRGLVRFKTADLQLWVEHGCPERNQFESLQRDAQ